MRFENIKELQKHLSKQGKPVTIKQLEKLEIWEPPYDEADVKEILFKLGRGKQWFERTKEQIAQKEDALWSRKKYQASLDNMAAKWGIPKEGFTEAEQEREFLNRLSKLKLRDAFEDDLKQLVLNNSSSRLPLSEEWIWAVERHLFSRNQTRQKDCNAAVMMVQLMSPLVEVKYNKSGEPVGVYVNADLPEIAIREIKKDLKNYEQELGLQPKKRGKVAHKRDMAKELYENPTKAGLHSQKVLRQRYRKVVED